MCRVERKMICGKKERVTEGSQTNDTQTQGHTEEAEVDVCEQESVLFWVCISV